MRNSLLSSSLLMARTCTRCTISHLLRGRQDQKRATLDPRARAESALGGLTCGYGGQWPESGHLSHCCVLYLHVEHSSPAQVRATWRSICRGNGPVRHRIAASRRPASEQVNRLSDDFARALEVRPGRQAGCTREELSGTKRSVVSHRGTLTGNAAGWHRFGIDLSRKTRPVIGSAQVRRLEHLRASLDP